MTHFAKRNLPRPFASLWEWSLITQNASVILTPHFSASKVMDYHLENKESSFIPTLPLVLVSIQHCCYFIEELYLLLFILFREEVVTYKVSSSLSPSLRLSMRVGAAGPWCATAPSCWLITMMMPRPCTRSSREASTYLVGMMWQMFTLSLSLTLTDFLLPQGVYFVIAFLQPKAACNIWIFCPCLIGLIYISLCLHDGIYFDTFN